MCYGFFLAAAVAVIKPPTRFTLAKAAAKARSLRCFASAPKLPGEVSELKARTAQRSPKPSERSSKTSFAAMSWAPGTAKSQNPRASMPGSSDWTSSRVDPSPARRAGGGVSDHEISYSVVIAGFARKGRPDAAAMFLEAMPQNGVLQNVMVFNEVIAAFAAQANVDQSVAWFRKMEEAGLKPNVLTLTYLIDACAKAGLAEQAVRWFRSIEERGMKPTLVSYNTVINAFARLGQVSDAMDWFERLQEAAIEPDQVSYNSVLHSCAVCSKPSAKQAENVFRQMRHRKVQANAATMTTLERAVGTDRRNELCAELQIDVKEALNYQGKRQHRKVKPLAGSKV